jgi:uncharacterized membrane protein YeaQ/YmgE (transglycosylase-associated protein family)
MAAMAPLFEVVFGLEGFEATAFWLVLFVSFWIIGFALDVILQSQGFGPFLNGVLAFVGAFVGLYIRYNYRFDVSATAFEPYLTIGLILAPAALLLIALSALRSRFG